MFCSKCGKELNEDAVFCDACGTPVKSQTEAVIQKIKDFNIPTALISCIVSILSTIYTLYYRISNWEFLYREPHPYQVFGWAEYYGIQPDKKPLISFLPITSVILVMLLLRFDKTLPTKKKAWILIFSILLAILSLLLIWVIGDERAWILFPDWRR